MIVMDDKYFQRDVGIYHFIANNIYDVRSYSVANAGYITGWIATFF